MHTNLWLCKRIIVLSFSSHCMIKNSLSYGHEVYLTYHKATVRLARQIIGMSNSWQNSAKHVLADTCMHTYTYERILLAD